MSMDVTDGGDMRALVLSGGGVRGAYQAGAIQCLVGRHKQVYDIFAGSSVGALNAAFLAQYAPGDEVDGAFHLSKLWKSIEPKHVYKFWYGGILGPLPMLWTGSVYNAEPLTNLVTANLKPLCVATSGKKLRVVAVSTSTVRVNVWTEQDADIRTGVLASCAYPGVLPSVAARSDTWVDGCVQDRVPIQAAIDAGATDIDVVHCVAPQSPSSHMHRWVAKQAAKYHVPPAPATKTHVNLRVLTVPALVDHDFEFRNDTIRCLFTQGYEDAESALHSKAAVVTATKEDR